MQTVRSSCRNGCLRSYRRAHFMACRVQRPQSGLSSVTNAIWERAGRVLRQFGVQKTEVQYETTVEVVEAPGSAAATAEVVAESDAGSSSSSSSSSSTGDGNELCSSTSSTNGGSGRFSSPESKRSHRCAFKLEVRVVSSISEVSREEWDSVATRCGSSSGSGPLAGAPPAALDEVNPFLLWAFLHALEESGSVGGRTGWLPQHILVRQVPDEPQLDGSASSAPRGHLVGCVPLYLKGHSYGEYVFDQSWADFASMLGVRYYPKLQAAVPFTPVTGPRLLVSSELAPAERAAVVRALGRTLIDLADSLGVSGVHVTFTSAQEWAVLAELGFKQRLGIQFHWDNAGYGSFEDFLADLKQSRRKSIRQERKSIRLAGLSLHRLPGGVLRPEHWDRFHSFYRATVDRKWGSAYLTREFFHCLGEALPDRVLLVAASEGGLPASPCSSSPRPPSASSLVAGALNLAGSHCLYGRNWGQRDVEGVRNLHFELCYYQALEEAISRGLPRVEAGAQGEHKLQRGYLPSFTYSCHYLRDPRLAAVVDRFLARERGQIEYSLQVMSVASSPYKKERTVEALVSKLRSYNSLSSSSSSSSSLDVSEGEGEAGRGAEDLKEK